MQLLAAIGASLWLVALIGDQAAPTGALSAEARTHLQNERFQVVTSLRGLPLGVRNGLQRLFESQSLDIAEPGAEFGRSGTNANLPNRRLVAAGCSYDHCLVYYERIDKSHTWQVTLFHWSPKETRFEWGGTAGGGHTSIDDIRAATLSGAIKSTAGPW
jgi:hypothetical protein